MDISDDRFALWLEHEEAAWRSSFPGHDFGAVDGTWTEDDWQDDAEFLDPPPRTSPLTEYERETLDSEQRKCRFADGSPSSTWDDRQSSQPHPAASRPSQPTDRFTIMAPPGFTVHTQRTDGGLIISFRPALPALSAAQAPQPAPMVLPGCVTRSRRTVSGTVTTVQATTPSKSTERPLSAPQAVSQANTQATTPKPANGPQNAIQGHPGAEGWHVRPDGTCVRTRKLGATAQAEKERQRAWMAGRG